MRAVQGEMDWVESVWVSAGGSRLFSGGTDKTITVLDAVTGAGVQTM